MAVVLDVSFKDIQGVVSSLCSTVRSGFGPSFRHTIISTDTGKVLITNHGIQIVKTLQLKHPVAKFAVTSVTKHYKAIGDDSKTFYILLNDLLLKASLVIDSGPTMLKLSQDISFVLNEVTLLLFQDMDRFCARSIASAPKKWALMQSLFLGTMNTHVHDCDATHLSLLLAEFVSCWHSSRANVTMKSTVEMLLESQKFLLIESFGKPLSRSCSLPGYFISRGFCNASRLLNIGGESVNVIFLSCPIDTVEDDGLAVEEYKVSKNADQKLVNMVVEHKRFRTNEFLEQVNMFNVSLIVTSVQLSTIERTLCYQHKITAIHTVPEEELGFVSQMCNADTLFDTRELGTSHIGQLKRCEQVILGTDTYVNLQPTASGMVCSLVIEGPTEAISRQAKLLVVDSLQNASGALVVEENCLYQSVGAATESVEVMSAVCSMGETLRMSVGEDSGICGSTSCSSDEVSQLSPMSTGSSRSSHKQDFAQDDISNEYLYTIPVGGAFELALHHTINNYLRSQAPGAPGTTALTILKEALLAVPQQIHTNAYCIAKPRWLQTLARAKETLKLGHVIGVNAVDGTITNSNLTHSFPNKCLLIVNVLTTLRQLLRLDQTV